MRRDIKKRAEEGRNILKEHPRHDLSLSELNQVYKMFKDATDDDGIGMFDAICTVFDLGVATGARIAK